MQVAKNLVLAGAGWVSIADDGSLASSHVHPGNFLVHSSAPQDPSKLTVASACVHTLSAMNPLIKVSCQPFSFDQHEAAFYQHDTIIASVSSFDQMHKLEAGARAMGKQLFCCMLRGPNSFTFVSLGKHTYTEKSKDGIKGEPIVIDYPSLAAALSAPLCKLNKKTHPLYLIVRSADRLEKVKGRVLVPEDLPELKALAAKMVSEEGSAFSPREDLLEEWLCSGGEDHLALAPSSAILGGIVANHVIRAVSLVSAPINNFFFYSLFNNDGIIEQMG